MMLGVGVKVPSAAYTRSSPVVSPVGRFPALASAYTKSRAMAQHQKEPDIPTRHLSEEKRRELDEKARQGETVVPGGTGGKSLEAQERLAEGRSRGGQTRSGQLGTEGYEEMGRKGGKSAGGKSAEEAMAEKGVHVDESKFKTKSKD